MATGGGSPVPRRRQKTNSIKRGANRSSIDILVQMGFPKPRAEKALAATGDRGVQLASDWLLSHVHDKMLDNSMPRQYILYLCPVGGLQDHLIKFWEKSLSSCGWNGAHSYLPHVTLCSFFSVEDQMASKVKEGLFKLKSALEQCPGRLNLDFYSHTAGNFIGLFVQDVYYKFLCDVINQFGAEMKSHGIEFTGPKKQLHVTLAYQYSAEHHEELSKLARQIDLTADCTWEMRLYSRDQRLGKSEVRKVLKAYKADLEDELDLIMGDYVFMDTNETTRSEDGWYSGTSWLTGVTGMFPGTYTKRTAETWAWALHGALPLIISQKPVVNGVEPQQTTSNAASSGECTHLRQSDDLYAKVVKKKERSSIEKKVPDTTLTRQLYVMRHGERMDFVFGRQWCEKCFDESGNYVPTDLNMPSAVPARTSEYLDYVKDAPLTSVGNFQAFLTGEGLRAAGVKFHHVYVSPSLRCIQTATAVLKSIGISPVMRIEPGIFEWLGWYQLGLPKWFTPSELKAHGFNIDTNYIPFFPISKLDYEEDIAGYYKRSGETTRNIMNRHEQEVGNTLILGHAGSLEVCTRLILGKPPRSSQDFRELCSKVPYCGLLALEEDQKTKKWSVKKSPILPLTHGQNKHIVVENLLYPL